jgi:hypothetical protein
MFPLYLLAAQANLGLRCAVMRPVFECKTEMQVLVCAFSYIP